MGTMPRCHHIAATLPPHCHDIAATLPRHRRHIAATLVATTATRPYFCQYVAAMWWQRGIVAVSSPCLCHVLVMSSSCRRDVVVTSSQVAMLLSLRRHVVATPWPCRCHARSNLSQDGQSVPIMLNTNCRNELFLKGLNTCCTRVRTLGCSTSRTFAFGGLLVFTRPVSHLLDPFGTCDTAYGVSTPRSPPCMTS